MTKRRKIAMPAGNSADSRAMVQVDPASLAPVVAGPGHRNLAMVEDAFDARLTAHGGDLAIVAGDPLGLAQAVDAVQAMIARAAAGGGVSEGDTRAAIAFARSARGAVDGAPGAIHLPGRRAAIIARTPVQSVYVRALLDGQSDLVFGVGPAGTGKTFLAVAAGVSMLLEGRIARVVVTRPAVEAGERLGFLPGDLEEKVDPYLQPIWDAFKALLGPAQFERRRAANEIEIAPLAFMRGRTLSDAFVIVDEAQNTTRMQMKMLLTRLGEGSRMAVNGDPTQIDLPRAGESGLADALRVLRGTKGIEVVRFGAGDVVRHPLVARIVAAYEADTRAAGTAAFGAAAGGTRDDKSGQSQAVLGGFTPDSVIDEPKWSAALGDMEAIVAKTLAAVAAEVESRGETVAVLFTDDAAVRMLNARWRGQDKPTNVLSFPAAASPDGAPAPGLGDIALAFETCAAEADAQSKTLHDHAVHLLVHGVLHLLGYDHEDEDDASEMEGLEREILARLGVADPYDDHG